MPAPTKKAGARRAAPAALPSSAVDLSKEIPWQAPDTATFLNPWDCKPLLGYYRDLLSVFGFIRLLGLPQLKDNSDIPIESLFVEPEFSDSPISPEAPLENWPPRGPFSEALLEHPRLVVLGDPGAGKTTLQNWLVSHFCRSGSSRLQRQLGPLVPIPIVLRELTLARGLAWLDLLDLFLERPVAEKLRDHRDLIEDLFQRGQALVMLDGLDEIANESSKDLLKTAVLDGMRKHPSCRWLMTSRIVGYDRMPFHTVIKTNPSGLRPGDDVTGMPAEDLVLGGPSDPLRVLAFEVTVAKRVYLAPFDTRQIEAFVRNWYMAREANAAVRDECIRELLKAIRENEGTLRLARVPNLLTMMALIHRVRARLPQGRVNLYRDITEAYLQTIDDFRGLKETAYSLPQKKLWLARIAFEMQSRRKERPPGTQKDQVEGLLLVRSKVLEWLVEVMDVPNPQERAPTAEKFLDYLQRRTGLFIERSPGQWAFLHLSFQEYFTACFLAEEVTGPDWLSPDYDCEGCRPSDLQQYSGRAIWKETLIFLFELLGQERPRWSDRVAGKVFEKTFAKPATPDLGSDAFWEWQCNPDVVLLAELSVDAYSGFSTKLREEAWAMVWRCSFPQGSYRLQNPAADALFADAPQFSEGIWRTCLAVAGQSRGRCLNLTDCRRLEDVSPLAHIPNLDSVDLWESRVRCGLSNLVKVRTLRSLELTWPGNLENPLDLLQCDSVVRLNLKSSQPKCDLKCLAPLLVRLERLGLYEYEELVGTEVLKECSQLTDVTFNGQSQNEQFSYLVHLPHLKKLWLNRSLVIQSLKELPISAALESLTLSSFDCLSDLNPSEPLRKLKSFGLWYCPMVADLSPLEKFTQLEAVEFHGCDGLTTLAPLTNCPHLAQIVVVDCPNLHDIPDSLRSKLVKKVTL